MNILFNWKAILEILILTVFFYYVILFIKDTPIISVLKLLIVLFLCFFIAQKLQLHTINWVLTKIFAILVVALIVIFQPELRRALVHLGEGPFFGMTGVSKQTIADEISKALISLSKKKIGALIAIEREIGLKNYIETGIKLNSIVSSELIETIFMPNTPLHDGGVIIQEDRITGAACIFPLTQNLSMSRLLGTRHQAALGLSEETDAMVFVVSEETGIISLAYRGKLTRGLDEGAVKRIFSNLYAVQKKKKRFKIIGRKS